MKKFLFLFILGLQACGQTGPLYLTDDEAPLHVEGSIPTEVQEN